jgi:hypothetical protein
MRTAFPMTKLITENRVHESKKLIDDGKAGLLELLLFIWHVMLINERFL